MKLLASLLCAALFAAACTDTGADTAADDLTAKPPTIRAVRTVADAQKPAPALRGYRIHAIDVGTGLSILVQGHAFNLLYDGGSGDDLGGIGASGNNNRLLAYLFAALGASGPAECAPAGDAVWKTYKGGAKVTIHHLFLSHPHLDHGSMLADVLHCYDVQNVWDSGAINDTQFYRDFVQAVAAEPGVAYHTAAAVPTNRSVRILGTDIAMPAAVKWTTFDDTVRVQLDANASFAVLNADGVAHANANQNSTVLRLDLGATSLLLVGDAESGARKDPKSGVGDIEAALLARHKAALDVDILQVGHHGSSTSTRSGFLDAVTPKYAIIGVGPKAYAGVVFPDKPIVDELTATKAVLIRTDATDGKCPVADKIGLDTAGPAGCDTQVIEIPPLPARSPAIGHEVPKTCKGRCGDDQGTCRCDASCLQRNDCCADVCNVCGGTPQCSPRMAGPPTSAVCEGNCGESTTTLGVCSCADSCRANGNCCMDLCTNCSSAPFCAEGYEDDPFAK